VSRITREIPKAIAAFGEKQFKETGAAAVEVLRVKTAVMRKHFRQLKGIAFLVAVISLDRIRVYFFNAAGIMLSGENLDASIYSKVRKSSKLIAKFEKPKMLTQEELRIEATQELRDNFGKSIRKVTRFLAAKEPPFPDIYVIRTRNEEPTQSFGMQVSSDFEFLFEETVLSQNWIEGLLIRSAFLLHLEKERWFEEIANGIGNALAQTLLRDPIRNYWIQMWKKQSKGTKWASIVTHFQKHHETYSHDVFNWLVSVVGEPSLEIESSSWIEALSTIHDSVIVPVGTSDYHMIDGFCKALEKPNQLMKRLHTLESIHLAPRVLCDSSSIGSPLSVSFGNEESDDSWANVKIVNGSSTQTLKIGIHEQESVDALEYWLNLEDIYPSTAGPFSHGLDIVRRSLEKLGVTQRQVNTFHTKLVMKSDRSLDSKEIAVLERLLKGDLEIISNTLIGSPQIVRSLVEKNCIVFVPDFNHLGIGPDFLIHGSYHDVQKISHSTLEATIIKCETNAFGIVSAPTSWRKSLLESSIEFNLEIWPILSIDSERRLLRKEELFIDGNDVLRWSDGST
jgi:hypothetical protein